MVETEKDKLDETVEKIKKLEHTIKRLQEKVDELEKKPPLPSALRQLDDHAILELEFMNLPDNLRRTIMALIQLGEATPEDVANATNRTRGLENIYLNQLELLGYIEKSRKGKRVYFRSLRSR